MPVTFDIDRDTDLTGDGGDPGVADPGDTLTTTVTITNTGDEDSTNTTFRDSFFGSTLTDDINISPIAFNDAFTAVGNTVLRVGGAANIGTGPSLAVTGNLLDNDVGSSTDGTGVITGDDVPGFTIVAVTNGVSAGGGTFNVFADGSFNYVNEAGDTGTDTFEYTIRDAGLDGIAGNADDLESTATVTITLSGEVWYVDSAAAGGGTGTSANPFNSITALNTANDDGANDYIYVQGNAAGQLVLDTGQHLIGTGADLDVNSFHLADDGARSTITGSSAGFTVTLAGGGTGNNEIAGINIVSTGGTGNHALTGTSFGTLTVNNATIDASGQGLILSTGTFAGNGFVSTDSDGGTSNVSLTTVTGTVALGSGALAGATGDAFFVSGGTAGITYSGSITKSAAGGEVVDISTHATGNIALSGAINASGGSSGIRLVNNTSGNIDFTNTAVNLNTGTNAGINFTNINATGANVSFTGGNLNIDTSTGAGINATNSNTAAGSLTISGGNNVVDKTGGSGNAVFIDGVASNVTLLHVNATASSTGTLVTVRNNGGTGSFTITGTGSTAASGGTLNGATGADGTNAAGIGIFLENANNISLSNLNLAGTYQNFGIRGINVDDFTLRDSTLNGTYGTSIGLQEAAIRFGSQGTSTNGLSGIGLFEGNNISGGVYDNVGIFNGTATSSTITFQDSANDAAQIGHNGLTGNDGILYEIRNGHTGSFTVNGVTFTGARGDMVQTSVQGTGTLTSTITNNTFHNTHGDITSGGGGITVSGGENPSNYNLTYNISNNSLRGAEGSAIFVSTVGTTGTISGVIANNTIGVNDANRPQASIVQATTGASANGNGIDVRHEKFSGAGTFNHAVRIQGNTITDVTGSGIYLRSNNQGSGTGRLEATILNNVIEEVGEFTFGGISAIAGGSAAGDTGMLGLTITGNTVNLDNTSGLDGDNNAIVVDQVSSASIVYVPGVGGPEPNRGESIPPAGGTASAQLSTLWGGSNTLTNGEFPNHIGGTVDGTLIQQLRNDPFVLAVPLLAADSPLAGLGWEDLLDEPLVVAPTEPDQAAGDPAAEPDAPAEADACVVADDGVLSQAELALIVDAAIARWAAAGATEAQLAAMRAVAVSVSDLGGLTLGASQAGTIVVDDNAAGWRWFVDTTPGDDSEFAGDGSVLEAVDGFGAAGTRMDLLTVVMHELGHQIGLEDTFAPGADDALMYGTITAGERRLPGADEVANATGEAVSGAFAISPINIGTLPEGQSVTIQWEHTIDAPGEDRLVGAGGQAFVDSDQTAEVASLAEIVSVDGLTLGDLVFRDINENGFYDAGDGAAVGVTLSLFADTNNDGNYDAGTDLAIVFQDVNLDGNYDIGIDTPLAAGTTGVGVVQLTATTDAGGLYSFANLAPGDYIVVVDAANFGSGGALENRQVIATANDPDDNVENDNNAQDASGTIATRAITLAYDTEPTAGAGNDTNTTLDLGFFSVPVAQDDDVTTDEATAITGGDLFADNGNGADVDPDNPLVVSEVNGQAGDVGNPITLASGATLTVNSDGTFDYDPNGAFDYLVSLATGAATGAVNTSATDSFTYTLDDGNTATVTVTITGLDSAGDELHGDGGNNTLTGTPNIDLLRGFGGDDTITGLASGDLIVGGTGDDDMTGGLGDDDYYVDSALDTITEVDGEGLDRVAADASYTLAAGVSIELLEVEHMALTTAIDLTGNEFAQVLVGNDGINTLNGEGDIDILAGLGGNDTLNGGDGNDLLIGSAGDDAMDGGDGDDTFYVEDAGDTVAEAVGEGTLDRVATSISYTLAAGAEIERLDATNLTDTGPLTLTGNEFAQTIIGNAGINTLDGGGGNDVLFSFTANDVLTGGDGDDILMGDGGDDDMTGGTGNDTYVVEQAGDTIVEVDGEGIDRVATSVSFTLGAGISVERIEAVTLSDTTAIDLTGNELGNLIAGNAGDNVLDGKGGIDVLDGHTGADSYRFSTALGAGNVDRVNGMASGTDTIELDDAIFTVLATGALAAGAFNTGALGVAAEADDRIIYDTVTGALYYDADGSGLGSSAVQFAILDGAPALAASDFMVI